MSVERIGELLKLTAVIAMLPVAACQITGPDTTDVLPYLGDSGIAIVFNVPATVTRGVPFEATFIYRGSSSCTKDIRIDANIEGTVATLDSRVRMVDGVCTADLHSFSASHQLQFNTPGAAQVRLRGIFAGRDTVVVRNVAVQ